MSSFLIWFWLSLLRVILKLIHFAYSVYEFFELEWVSIKRKFKNFLQVSVSDSQTYVSDFAKKLTKCPSHLVVIVGEDGINFKDFSNLVVWCLAAKISFISFYDYSGFLNKNKHIYYQYLIEKRKLNPKSVVLNVGKQNTQNGVLSKIYLNIFTMQDGKPLFVELTKKLSQSVISNRLKITEINENLITSNLHKLIGLPEPDLGVVCGKAFSTFGFLPWHIRFTEFLQVKNLNGIKPWEFTSILMAYSSCTQRFGK